MDKIEEYCTDFKVDNQSNVQTSKMSINNFYFPFHLVSFGSFVFACNIVV